MTTNKSNHAADRIEEVATAANAAAYATEYEKFTFCIDLLEISAHRADADELVNALEDRFDEINATVEAEGGAE
jgi:hypothetical protein|tara:strand:+ start:1250 stop:1471 length:222 start_codon:yes stop_codon:yes gene_type:complete